MTNKDLSTAESADAARSRKQVKYVVIAFAVIEFVVMALVMYFNVRR